MRAANALSCLAKSLRSFGLRRIGARRPDTSFANAPLTTRSNPSIAGSASLLQLSVGRRILMETFGCGNADVALPAQRIA